MGEDPALSTASCYSRVGKNRASKPAEKESMKRVLGSPVPPCRGTVCLEVLRVRERHRHTTTTEHRMKFKQRHVLSRRRQMVSGRCRIVSWWYQGVVRKFQRVSPPHPHRDHQRAMSDAGTPWIDGTETRRLDVLACTAKCCPYDILANAANPQNNGEVEQPEGVHSFPRTFPLPRWSERERELKSSSPRPLLPPPNTTNTPRRATAIINST